MIKRLRGSQPVSRVENKQFVQQIDGLGPNTMNKALERTQRDCWMYKRFVGFSKPPGHRTEVFDTFTARKSAVFRP